MPKPQPMPIEWPADRVERWPIDTLVAYARNARTHSPEQVEQIAQSIREFGWTIPVLVDETGELIAGHGRTLAAHKLGLPDVPVMVARGWSDAKKKAYRLADNKLAENAGWDEDLLRIELRDLVADAFDVTGLGFSEKDIDRLLNFAPNPGEGDPDAVPEVPADPVSRPGDIWLLGAYFECEECGKRFSYAEGVKLNGECDCGRA
jgi:ParB-like chromosome segregation protein Spo0J